MAQAIEWGWGGEERKETLADKTRDFENHPLECHMPEFAHRHLMLPSAVKIDQMFGLPWSEMNFR